jgi:hypothetical protein
MIKTITQEGARIDIERLDDEINAMAGWRVIETTTKFINLEMPGTPATYGHPYVDPTGWVIRLVTMISIDS